MRSRVARVNVYSPARPGQVLAGLRAFGCRPKTPCRASAAALLLASTSELTATYRAKHKTRPEPKRESEQTRMWPHALDRPTTAFEHPTDGKF